MTGLNGGTTGGKTVEGNGTREEGLDKRNPGVEDREEVIKSVGEFSLGREKTSARAS